jgi:Protein of unknown function (DUF3987)
MARDYVADVLPLKLPVDVQTTPEPPRLLMRESPPADPFPIDALGDALGPAARAINDRVQAPPAICGQSVLAAATLAVQAHADVELPTGQRRPLTCYFLTIAATGERKTATDNEALRPVQMREAKLQGTYDAKRHEFENEKLGWEKAREAAIKAAKGDRAQIKADLDLLGPPPLPPPPPLLTCPEPTWEGVTKLLASSWPSLGIFTAEGGQFIGGHGMSDDAKLRTAAGMSCTWDGEPIKRVRAADGVTVLPGRRLAMHLMAQPDVAVVMLNDPLLSGQGLLSRMLVTAPGTSSGRRMWREPSATTEPALKKYVDHLLNILEQPLPLVAGSTNTLAPRALPLSSAARADWIKFYNSVEERVGCGGVLEPIRGLANKLPEHAARMAAVLAMVRDIEANEVTVGELEAGIDLAEHYAAEALRLFGASQVDADLLLAQRLLDWLYAWPEEAISLPDIYQRGLNAIGDQATARRLVTILEDHGHLVRIPEGAIVAGHRRREAWIIVRGG